MVQYLDSVSECVAIENEGIKLKMQLPVCVKCARCLLVGSRRLLRPASALSRAFSAQNATQVGRDIRQSYS